MRFNQLQIKIYGTVKAEPGDTCAVYTITDAEIIAADPPASIPTPATTLPQDNSRM